MAKAKSTDGSLLGSLPWTLLALAVAIAPHLPYLSVWISFTFLGCAALRLQIERRRWRLPGAWLRVGLAILGFTVVFATYDSISGVGPGSALLTVMAALKLLETKARRDQFVLLFIAIFLVMASLLREQFVWSLPYLIVGVFVTMAAWLQMSVSRNASARRAFRTSARLIAYAAPLTLVMWFFFPRIATPFWAVPIDTSSGVTGLSDEMSPGDLSSLAESKAVAFRVRFDDAVPEPRDRYWRGLVLHRFDGRKWTGFEPSIGARDSWPIEYLGEPVSYEVTLEPTRQRWIFALDLPYEWSLDMTYMGRQQQLARAQPIDQRVVYDAVSYPAFRLDPAMHNYSQSYHTRLPEDDSNPRAREFAQRLRAESPSARAYVEAVMQHFHDEEFYYTLQPPTLGGDPVDEFLFSTRRGFCAHYASTLAVLMRAANIPARIVVGYQGGELNPMSDYMIVRQSDAHAWTEVWFEGEGWVRVDPTSAVAPERIETGMSGARFAEVGETWGLSGASMLTHRLTLAWDMLNAEWNEWVLAYGPDNQTAFLRWLGMEQPNLRKMLLTLVGIVTLMLLGLAVLLAWRYRPPKRDAAGELFHRFTQKSGVQPKRGEAPLAYIERALELNPQLGGSALAIVNLYLKTRYGSEDEHDLQRLRRAVAGFTVARA